ncbi:hypothetical protein OIU77_007026 [Salix suchowensis]|uniref:Uncharacterized protein n=1 Tax=Salix suchowensis TaxID=1278906 RepID=A0ABQ9AML4_9ROSI|nr:hypothetical protein OIU77_007026 [Salix suchowensis]
MEFAGNNESHFYLRDSNNLSENSKMSLIQGFCKGKRYEIFLAGGEIPEWFSHRGEGAALSFHLPSVSVPDGNKLQALLFWVVFATPKTSSLPFDCSCFATFKNKSNGMLLFPMSVAICYDRNFTKHSWIRRVPLIELEEWMEGVEELLQGVEELELNVEVTLFPRIVRGTECRSSIKNNGKCWVEKCGVHLIMEKRKADSDIHVDKKGKWDHAIDLHALGSLTTDDQRLESSLIRELPKLKIIELTNHRSTQNIEDVDVFI